MEINIAYSSDDNYIKFAGISMISLFENNKDIENINIYLVENDISKKNKEYIYDIVNIYNRKITFIDHKKICSNLKTDNQFNISAFSRLFLSNIEDVDKMLYLDCDTIVNGSLVELFDSDFNYYVGGVQDTAGSMYRNSVGLDNENRYINSGVLLINLKKWREDNIESQFIDFINYYKGSVPHHDQGVINGVFKDKIKILDPKYNVMPPMLLQSKKQIEGYYEIEEYYTDQELNIAKNKPIIIHFTESFYNRPWRKKCKHPYKDLFFKYKDMSPWKDMLLEDKDIPKGDKVKALLFKYVPLNLIIKLRNIKRSVINGFNIKCCLL